MFDRDPEPNMPLFYTDLAEIAEAARFGELDWDTSAGHCHITPDEESVIPWRADTNPRNQSRPSINTGIRRCTC
jgi:hypothetical protein